MSSLYRYVATSTALEDFTESGTIVARSEMEAKRKLRRLQFDRVHLRKVNGLRSIFGKLTATVK